MESDGYAVVYSLVQECRAEVRRVVLQTRISRFFVFLILSISFA
jgi:hypothetical protein